MNEKKRILVVDDEPDVLTYICMLLEDNGYETLRVEKGNEAAELAISYRPDLITLDISMPEQSGVRTIKQLKENSALASIPIIIVTGIGEPMNAFIQKIHHFPRPQGFIAKPIDREELLGLVKQLLG